MLLYSTLKIIHLLALISWFAGLFYLPRLFVYHAVTEETQGYKRFCVMEHKLYYYIMYPAMIVTFLTGIALAFNLGLFAATWLQLKIALVIVLLAYHLYSGYFLKRFKLNQNTKSHVFFRFFNEVPTVLLIFIIILVVVRPFF